MAAALIKAIIPGSIAAEVGLESGDTLCSINGQIVADILDYQFAVMNTALEIEVTKADGQTWLVDIEKDEEEDLGIILDGFIFDRMKVCANRCGFCFVDQLPSGLRPTLKVKDDDYRHSFLFGNFITLTNLKQIDWEKIVSMRLSPLYVSVHAIDPEVRAKLLNNPQGGLIKEQLRHLCMAGIQLHTQIVLCPGINDGDILKESIEQLADFYPGVQSIGVVPVGLSSHRLGLTQLVPVDAEQAAALIDMADLYQQSFRRQHGLGLVYLADEFYLKAGRAIPDSSYYDGFEQLENGIGLIRLLWDEFGALEESLPQRVEPREVHIVSGVSGITALQPIVLRLNQIDGLTVKLIPVVNRFLGESITVTGLLCGQDIIAVLGEKYKGKNILLPEIILKADEDILLDDISLAEISQASGAAIQVVPVQARDLVGAVIKNK